MNTTNLLTQTLYFLSGTTSLSATHMGVGTSQTIESQSGTSLFSQTATASATIQQEGQVGMISATILNTGSSYTIWESGLLTASGTSGQLWNRAVGNTGITSGSSTQVEIIKFIATGTDNPGGSTLVTDSLLSATLNHIAGTKTPPAHTGYGIARAIERCESGTSLWLKSTDASSPTLNLLNFQSGTASINLGKTGNSGTSFNYQRQLSPAIDLSQADTFRIWLDILEVADLNKLATNSCLEIRLGSGTGHYKYYVYNKADLTNGWKEYSIPISSFSGSGSPSLSAISYIGLFFGTGSSVNTIAHGNLIMDYCNGVIPIDANDTDMNDQITSGTSTTVLSTNSVEYRETLTQNEGNAYNYEYFSLLSAAGTSGNLHLIAKSPRVVKTSSVQINPYLRLAVSLE